MPRRVLSDTIGDLMKGRTFRTGLFFTFEFEPSFFEQEVLAVVLDIPLSQEPALRLVQLEDAIQDQIDSLAVYYDPRGLKNTGLSPRLDVRRIPVHWHSGFFHPKNLFLLFDEPGDGDGPRPQSLLFATLSANLTRNGWWENVEVCHVEVLREGEKTSLREDLLRLLQRVKKEAGQADHSALDAVRKFVLGLAQRGQATSGGRLHPRLYSGPESVTDFLLSVCGHSLDGRNLEVVAPFVEAGTDGGPLGTMIETFAPRKVRVFLPERPTGGATVEEAVHERISGLSKVSWARLPGELMRSGKGEDALPRNVHAKVYRFWTAESGQEAETILVGSVNLTKSAHQKGGNLETAILLEPEVGRPEWWLQASDGEKPAFQPQDETAGDEDEYDLVPLRLSFDWRTGSTFATWLEELPSPELKLSVQGRPLFTLMGLGSGKPQQLEAAEAARMKVEVETSSFVTVEWENKRGLVLVEEEGMESRPSILLNLTVADILRCWASLTPEQKAVLLEKRFAELGPALMGKAVPLRTEKESFFDAYAGLFHAFGSLERGVLAALEDKRPRDAVYRLFGEKYDSLPQLLKKVFDDTQEMDTVKRYLVLLCTKQLVTRLKAEQPVFVSENQDGMARLSKHLERLDEVRGQFSFDGAGDRARFLEWFEGKFLQRATPAEEPS